MVTKRQRRRAPSRWVYAYELDPAQPEPRFSKIRALLRRAQRVARRGGRVWAGRVVIQTNITHILVVTDNPGQVHDMDRAIEVELRHLNMGFARTGPARFSVSGAKTSQRNPKKPARLHRKTRAA